MTSRDGRSWWAVVLCLCGMAGAWLPSGAQRGIGIAQAAESASADLPAGSIDPQSSRVYVFVGKVGLGHEHAIVGAVKSGTVRLGAAENAGEIVIDVASFVADTAEARKYIRLAGTTSAATQKEVTANMLGEAVLDARKYPTATFIIHSSLPLPAQAGESQPHYRLEGELTLHGTTQRLTLDAETVEQPGYVRLRGAFAIRQTAYNIKPFSKAFGAIGVADELSIYGELNVLK